MAVFRKPPTCTFCGKDYKAIHQNRGENFVGDTFVMWDHTCETMEADDVRQPRFRKENRQSIERLSASIVEESQKFKMLFVDWEFAKRLKAIGFDEPCFAYYWMIKDTFHYTVRYENHNSFVSRVSAPLIQQVVDWCDTQHVFIDVDHEFGEDWEFTLDNGGNGHFGDKTLYTSRFEATKHAIDLALKIIENGAVRPRRDEE